MVNKKDKMYDFGELGKWSEATLREQIKHNTDDFSGAEWIYVGAIEAIYNQKKDKNKPSYPTSSWYNKIRNFKKMNQEQFERYIYSLINTHKLKKELEKNYIEYREVIRNIYYKKESK